MNEWVFLLVVNEVFFWAYETIRDKIFLPTWQKSRHFVPPDTNYPITSSQASLKHHGVVTTTMHKLGEIHESLCWGLRGKEWLEQLADIVSLFFSSKMAKIVCALFLILCICVLAICAKTGEGATKRTGGARDQGNLSDEEHYNEKGEHNSEYDHEAFLGNQKKSFDQLTPEESKERLG